jgi:hypothetical protein
MTTSDASVKVTFDDMSNYSNHPFVISAATTSKSTQKQIALWYIMAYASPFCERVRNTSLSYATVLATSKTQACLIVSYLFPFRQSWTVTYIE